MPKADDLIKELQRRVRHLERLVGTLVRCADGPVLLDIAGVRDPFAAVDLGRKGPPAAADLAAALHLRVPPQRVTAAFVAKARRDLRALELGPGLAIARDAPRMFRGHGPLDDAWLADHAARIEAMTAALHPAAAPTDDWPTALVRARHGPAAADLLADWIDRSAALGTRRRREAHRRIDALVRRLLAHITPLEPSGLAVALDTAARAIARLARPGRGADRRLDAILRAVLAWPAADAHSLSPDPEASRPVPSDISSRDALVARVRTRAAPLLHSLAAAPTPARLAALRRTLTAYALAFAPDPAEPPPPVAPEALELADDRLRAAAALSLPDLPLPRALWLLRLPMSPAERATITPWISAGFPPALLERVIAHDQIAALARLQGDVDLAVAYADWLVRLVPHYRQLGIKLELPPAHFARLHATHRGGLALLAHCLIEHHAPGERGAEAQIARLRATLGLFAASPRRAESLLNDLSQAPAGLGRRTFPEFAAWLGDDALLDRFCRLCDLAGEPVALSHTLRRDLERIPRIQSQRDWLAAQPLLTPDQSARLARLTAEIAASELADPAWTRRRLDDRNDALQARAFARRLDEILRDLLHESIGVAPQTLTPAWRDAVRFYVGESERNRGLLTRLLRFAAANPGRPIAATLPLGQAWLTAASTRMRTEPWLAPRRRTVELAGQRHTITLEHDPLEVLRMGMPFDTCLSLSDGFNADSTILNAVDPNKRVLYVRDARGQVVARKLLAVSTDFTLLGYRLYLAADLPGIGAAVRSFCDELAADCTLALTDTGAPAQIHPGFWYDDTPVAWHGPDNRSLTALAPYFARLGRPRPDHLGDWMLGVLHARDAVATRDIARARALLPSLRSCSAREPLGDLIAEALGPRALARAARTDEPLATVHLARTARLGAPALLHAAAAFGRFPHLLSGVVDALDHFPASADIARAWLAAATRTRRDAPHYDDHSLEHRTFQADRHLALLPIAELLTSCSSLAATWDWVLQQSPSCTDCRFNGEYNLRRAAETAFARAPDPAAVVSALQGRHGRLAQDVALHLAARFSLSPRTCPLGHGLGATWLTRLGQRPLPAQHALTALRAVQRARPDLADSVDLFAALVRQAGPHTTPTDLPTPGESPLPILAEFLLHITDPAALLARWLEPDRRDAAKWSPDRWDLHIHRRTATAWRRRLTRLAARAQPDARLWQAVLGDAAGDDIHAAITRDIDAQRALQPVPWDSPAVPPLLDLRKLVHRARELDQPPSAVLDLLHIAAAAHVVLRAPLHAAPDPDLLARAFDQLRLADLDHYALRDLTASLLPGDGPPAPAVVPLLAELLPHHALRDLDHHLLARMAAAPDLHAPIVARLLGDMSSHFFQFHSTYSHLERVPCPDPAARDRLLADLVARAGDRSARVDTPMTSDDHARFLACLPIWTARPADEWLLLYREQHDLHFQSLVLDARLAAITPEDRQHLRTLVETTWDVPDPRHEPDETAARAWLLTALTD